MKEKLYKYARIIIIAAVISSAQASAIYAKDTFRNTPIVNVIKECSPSVVNISTERIVLLQQHPYWGAYGNLFDNFFDQYSKTVVSTMKLKGVGSGVVISKDGLIITNVHVINMASKVYVVLSDGTACEAKLEAFSQKDDIAIIKIAPPKELKPVKVAADVIIGETVVSIGNPFGLENSVSAGIISGTNRGFSSPANNIMFTGLIQTDASINPGSSGGALFNLDGELVGINLAVVQNAQNIGFAIPAEKIKDILRQYEELKKKQAAVKIPVKYE